MDLEPSRIRELRGASKSMVEDLPSGIRKLRGASKSMVEDLKMGFSEDDLAPERVRHLSIILSLNLGKENNRKIYIP